MNTHSIMFRHSDSSIIRVGLRVLVKKESLWALPFIRIKRKKMVHRLLKKKFKPMLVVTSTSNHPGGISVTLKPFNF